MKSKRLHMVGNAHIDPVWLWMAPEGRQETLDTCRSVLDRMNENERFIFCCSSAAAYRWVEETDPALFEEIAQRVAEGRWVVVGGWWVQPDCNIPSGESLVRQGLNGQRYFRDRFGIECTVGYNVDTFGHAWSLAQLLPEMGLKYYVFFRPGPHEKPIPSPVFLWEGPDGTKTLTARPAGHYNTGPDDIEARIREAAGAIQPGLSDVMAFYGVGNHGGGPTRANIESIERLMGDPALPEVRFSHPEAFFRAVEATGSPLPTVRDELQHHARGCYTSVSAIKAANRQAEHALQDAELWMSLARVLAGREIARNRLQECWQTVLFNQFHDIMAGTSIRAACEQALRENQLVIDQCRHLTETSARAVAARVDTCGEGQGLVIFNPLGFPRDDALDVEVNWRNGERGVAVETASGERVPSQVLRSTWSGGGRSVKLLVKPRVQPCGYTTLRVKPDASVEVEERPADARQMDNGLLRVSIGTGKEWVSDVLHVPSGLSLVRPGTGGLIVLDDPSDTWSHGVDRFRDEIGRFEMVGIPEVCEWGPLRWRVRTQGAWGDSWVSQEFVLLRAQLDVTVEVDWHERHRMLKLSVPTRVAQGEATFEIPYGAIMRPQSGDEEPAQRWVDVSGVLADGAQAGTRCGVALLNDCKYGFDVLDGEIRMSVLRSPIYAFHDPAQVQPGEEYEYTEQGRHVFRYSLVPHPGDWREAGIPRLAAEFNRPCLALHEPAHAGPLPASYSLAATDQPNLDVETVKPAEAGEGIVFRIRETMGQATDGSLMLPGPQSVPLRFRAWEIKTLVATRGEGEWRVRATDLLERELPGKAP